MLIMSNTRFHIFMDTKDRAKVWLNLMPGTVGSLPASINMFSNLESFPVLSYPMKSQDGSETHARLYPPADPAKKFGLASLGLINSLAVPATPETPPVVVDPGNLVRCTRYHWKLQGASFFNKKKTTTNKFQ
jgi:hypothetical protein